MIKSPGLSLSYNRISSDFMSEGGSSKKGVKLCETVRSLGKEGVESEQRYLVARPLGACQVYATNGEKVARPMKTASSYHAWLEVFREMRASLYLISPKS